MFVCLFVINIIIIISYYCHYQYHNKYTLHRSKTNAISEQGQQKGSSSGRGRKQDVKLRATVTYMCTAKNNLTRPEYPRHTDARVAVRKRKIDSSQEAEAAAAAKQHTVVLNEI